MSGRPIRLPGYEFATSKWLRARYDSRAESFWYWMRRHLRMPFGRKSPDIQTGEKL